MFLALLWLAATVQLVDEVFEIPAREWKYADVVLRQQAAYLRASYEVRSGAGVRLWLVNQSEIDRFPTREKFQPVVVTPSAPSGAFDVAVSRPGDYALIVDNRNGAEPAKVLLRVELDFRGSATARIRYAERWRQVAVIGFSFAFFFTVVFYSARRLLRARR
jgi:hypothetical protein